MKAPEASVFYSKTAELILSALSFVVALAWRDAITKTIDYHVKEKLVEDSWFRNHPRLVYFIYAFVLTIIVVWISSYFQPR